MNSNLIVGISECKVADKGVITTYALGSCVGVSLYDATTKVGGLIHIMLPTFNKNLQSGKHNAGEAAD